ncbi:MAG: hypothetical protein P8Y94_16730 [Acidobacteriota bacterium]
MRNWVVYLPMLTLASSLLRPQESSILEQLDVGSLKSNGRVIAEQMAVGPAFKLTNGETGPQNRLLVVEAGSTIWEVDYVDLTNGPKLIGKKKLGRVINESERKLIESCISWDEVPFRAEWFTSHGTRFLLVLTWSVTRKVRAAGSVFFVYCFASVGERLHKVIESEGDLSLGEVDTCDVDEDGEPDLEVSGSGETLISGWMKVWRMRGIDRALKIGFDGSKGFNPTLVSGPKPNQCSIMTYGGEPEQGKVQVFLYVWDRLSAAFTLSRAESR